MRQASYALSSGRREGGAHSPECSESGLAHDDGDKLGSVSFPGPAPGCHSSPTGQRRRLVSEHLSRRGRGPAWTALRSTGTAEAMVVGGIIAGAAFVPFTIAHGPTSYNLEHEVLGGTCMPGGSSSAGIPPLLVGAGLWSLRALVACGRRATFRSLTVMCVAMSLFAAMNLAFRAMGPPFDLFLLALPAWSPADHPTRGTDPRNPWDCLPSPIAPLWPWGRPARDLRWLRGLPGLRSHRLRRSGRLWAAFGATLLVTERPRPPK